MSPAKNRAARALAGHHAEAAGDPWYVRAIEGFSHVVLSVLGFLLGHVWLPVGLFAAVVLTVMVGRVWGRHRLARAGS